MKDSADDALKRIIRILNTSDQSEKNIRTKLIRAGYSFDSIDEAVSFAKDYGFIDDERYARLYIESKLQNGKGTHGIVRELAAMDIDVFSIGEGELASMLDVDSNDELDRALALLSRKPSRSKNALQGSFSKLIRNGYSPQIAASASRIWVERNAL